MHTHFFLITLVFLCLLCTPAAAAEINAGSIALDGAGETASVPITIDEAVAGLAGYTIDISVTNPSVAEIIAVDYPGWASLSQSTSLPAGEVRVKAVDINREVEAGATNIPIATVTVKGQAPGSTTFTISPVRISDDNGEGIPSAPVQNALTVSGPADSGGGGGSGPGGSGSGSSGGSSSGGSSSSGSTSTGSTAGSRSTATASGRPSSGGQTVQPVHTPESWAPASSGQDQPSGQAPAAGGEEAPEGASQRGNTLDWPGGTLVPVGIAVAVGMLVLLFVAARRTSSRSP
jgi:hypothetical protein